MARASGLVGAGELGHVWAGSRELQTVNEGRGTTDDTWSQPMTHTPPLTKTKSSLKSKTTQMLLMFNGSSPGPTEPYYKP